MKNIFCRLAVFSLLFSILPISGAMAAGVSAGDLIKASQLSVYYYGIDGKRYVFPNEKTYKTWFDDFSTVKTITDFELAAISIGGNVTYKPGIKMVKIQTDPKVYAVAGGGTLRWIKNEAVAMELYGSNWNKQIDDVPDVFFTNYTIGSDINSASDYNKAEEIRNGAIINRACITGSVGCGVLSIYSENVSEITSTSAKIKWQTLWPTKGEVRYGAGSLDNAFIVSLNSFMPSQEIVLSNLSPNTLYKYKIIAEDQNGTKVESGEKSFTTTSSWVTYRITNSSFRQKSPGAAVSPDGLGVVWTDNSNVQEEIKFGVLDSVGNISKGPFILSFNNSESIAPSITWNGLDYGVVWEDSTIMQREIYFGRIDNNGNRPMFEKEMTNKPGFAKNPKIVWNGSNYGVFWWDTRSAGDVGYTKGTLYYQKMNLSGQLSGNNLQLVTRLSSEFKPDAVWGNNEYAIVWADNRESQKDIYFLRIDETGNIQGGGEVKITNTEVDSDNPAIVWDGINYGIVWQKKISNIGTEGSHHEIFYQKVDIAGQKIGESVRLTVKNEGDSESPKIVKNGNRLGVVWVDYRGSAYRTNSEIYFMEINSDGKILTPEQNISNSDGLSVEPSIAVLNGSYNIIYSDTRNVDYEIYSAHSQ